MQELDILKLLSISAIERILDHQQEETLLDWDLWREDIQVLKDTLTVLKDEPGASEAFDKLTGVSSLARGEP